MVSQATDDDEDDSARCEWPQGANKIKTAKTIYVCPVKGCGAHSSSGKCPREH